MKKLLLIVGIAVFVSVAALYGVVSGIGPSVEGRVKEDLKALCGTEILTTGFQVSRSAKSWKEWTFQVDKLEIKNIPSFIAPDLVVLSKVEGVFDPLSYVLGRWRILKLSATIDKSYVEIDSKGVLNISLVPALKLAPPAETASEPAATQFVIKRLELTLKKLYYVDALNSAEPRSTYDLGEKVEVFDNVTDPAILFQAPMMTYLSQLNKGSLGLSRGLMQENIKRHISQSVE